jgi:hypothetical protein
MTVSKPGAAWIAGCVFFLGGLAPTAALADSSARDTVNSASLLFPYFEVDLDDPEGSTTVISLRTAAATAALANVTVWTNTGRPVQSFPVYLTGYDVVNFNLRDMLIDGSLPRTASDGQDPADTISPQGPYSQDINFASCNGPLPYNNPVLLASTVAHLQRALTGQPSPRDGLCYGASLDDNVARGYLTVDFINQCTLSNPTEPGYFVSGGSGIGVNLNVLAGEYLLRDLGGQRLHTGQAVAIESSSADHSTPGNYTFYGRFTNWQAQDNREPLNGSWALDTQAKDVDVIVWRDTQRSSSSGFSCGVIPAPLPLGQAGLVHFDADTLDTDPLEPAAIPLATQKLRLGSGTFGGASGKSGWSYLNLNSTTVTTPGNPPNSPAAMQAYVEVLPVAEASGVGGGSAAAVPLDTANAAYTLPTPP